MNREANGAAIRSIRKAMGVSQVSLAAKAGIHKAYLCQIEHDLRRPSLDVQRRIAHALGVPLGTISYVPEPAGVAS